MIFRRLRGSATTPAVIHGSPPSVTVYDTTASSRYCLWREGFEDVQQHPQKVVDVVNDVYVDVNKISPVLAKNVRPCYGPVGNNASGDSLACEEPLFCIIFAADMASIKSNTHDPRDLFLFNPENDLALAFGEEGYTAPPLAAALRRDLQMLPAWYGSDNAVILSQNCDSDSRWLDGFNSMFGKTLSCIPVNHLQNHEFRYHPWGWNLDLRQRLINECVPAAQLPSREQVLQIRALSHRATAARLLSHLQTAIDYPFPTIPFEAHSVAEVQEFERNNPQCYIKAPWSGSGRGVYRILDRSSRNFITWTQGIINRQGSIMCERALRGIMDFALEFRCHEQRAEFIGYSVFNNDTHCSFDRGIVAPSSALRRLTTAKLGDEQLLQTVIDSIAPFIEREIAPHYSGYLGIDMMLYTDDENRTRLNPCVEINLRTTMGVVSSIIGDNYISENSSGLLSIEYLKTANVSEIAEARQKSNPPRVSNGRILSGTIPLAPVYPGSKYLTLLNITKK